MARSTRPVTRWDCSISASVACSSPAEASATSSCLEARSFLSASGSPESCLLSCTASRFRPCTASRMTSVGTSDCPSWPETTLPLRRAAGPALVGAESGEGSGRGRINIGTGKEPASGGLGGSSIAGRVRAGVRAGWSSQPLASARRNLRNGASDLTKCPPISERRGSLLSSEFSAPGGWIWRIL